MTRYGMMLDVSVSPKEISGSNKHLIFISFRVMVSNDTFSNISAFILAENWKTQKKITTTCKSLTNYMKPQSQKIWSTGFVIILQKSSNQNTVLIRYDVLNGCFFGTSKARLYQIHLLRRWESSSNFSSKMGHCCTPYNQVHGIPFYN